MAYIFMAYVVMALSNAGSAGGGGGVLGRRGQRRGGELWPV